MRGKSTCRKFWIYANRFYIILRCSSWGAGGRALARTQIPAICVKWKCCVCESYIWLDGPPCDINHSGHWPVFIISKSAILYSPTWNIGNFTSASLEGKELKLAYLRVSLKVSCTFEGIFTLKAFMHWMCRKYGMLGDTNLWLGKRINERVLTMPSYIVGMEVVVVVGGSAHYLCTTIGSRCILGCLRDSSMQFYRC